MNLSERVRKTETSPTMEFFEKTKNLISGGADIINLIPGEPDFPTPENIKAAAIKALESGFTKYTVNKGIIELREEICRKLDKENSIKYSPDEIIVSNGAKQSVYNAVLATVGGGDEVIIPAPYYVSYTHIVKLAGGVPVVIQTTEKDEFKISAEQLKMSITDKTKALILCNPCNPTGTGFTAAELEQLGKVIAEKDIFIIVDEVYEKLVYGGFKFTSLAAAYPLIKEKIITINGLSKTYAMTGWRVGYAAAEKYIIDAIEKIQSHSTSGINSMAQYAGVEALKGPQDKVFMMREELEKRMLLMHKALQNIEGISCRRPEGALYLFPDISGVMEKKGFASSTDFSDYLLTEVGVATVPGTGFGKEGYIRISFTSSMEKIQSAVERISKVLK